MATAARQVLMTRAGAGACRFRCATAASLMAMLEPHSGLKLGL